MNHSHLYFDQETKDDFSRVVLKNYHEDSKQKDCVVIKNGYILPAQKAVDKSGKTIYLGGVVDQNKAFVKNSIYARKQNEGALLDSYEFKANKSETTDKEVVYCGMLINHFGHFITEGMSRLWYWTDNSSKNLDIAFLQPKKQKVFPQFWDIMTLLGIKKEKIHFIKNPTQFKSIYVPTQAHVLNYSYTDNIRKPHLFIAQKLTAKKVEKLYLSRRKFKTGTLCLGEAQIENLFKKNGYHVVYPEKLSLREQIEYIKGAKDIAGISGTAMHMALFASQGTKITVLERSDSPVEEQALINQALKSESYYVGVNQNPWPVDHSIGPVLLGITQNLAQYFRDRNFKYDSKIVNQVKTSDAKAFIKEWLKLYSQQNNNESLGKQNSLVARRFLAMADAFIPLKKRIKQNIKKIKTSYTLKLKAKKQKD